MSKNPSNKKYEYDNQISYIVLSSISVIITGALFFYNLFDEQSLFEAFVSVTFYFELVLCAVNILTIYVKKTSIKQNDILIKAVLFFFLLFVVLTLIVFVIRLLYSVGVLHLEAYNLYFVVFNKKYILPKLTVYCAIIVKSSELIELLINIFSVASLIAKKS